MKESEDESGSSDGTEKDYLSKRAKRADNDTISNKSKKSKNIDHFEIENENMFSKGKSVNKKKAVYSEIDFSVDSENSRRSSTHSTKQWDNEENSNSKKFKNKIHDSALESDSKSKKWETDDSVFKDNETYSQKEIDSKILSHKSTSHGWESDEELSLIHISSQNCICLLYTSFLTIF